VTATTALVGGVYIAVFPLFLRKAPQISTCSGPRNRTPEIPPIF